ncbi:NAD(P)H-dependent oxidoreductase [Nocardiopsis coralliicola]
MDTTISAAPHPDRAMAAPDPGDRGAGPVGGDGSDAGGSGGTGSGTQRVLWLFAHPEARSLNGSLRDAGAAALRAAGHSVRESDLYAMEWDPVVRPGANGHDPAERFIVGDAAEHAFTGGTLDPEVRAEQEKLAWADTVVVQFPLWWYGMPAILKGWFDRVFTKGFAYGVADPATGRPVRYGEGPLAGKRALPVVTVGARPKSVGPRGVSGPLDEVLYPLTHGSFWYAGMSVLPTFTVYGADRATPADAAREAAALSARLLAARTEPPIPFRRQNGGDYDDDLVLRPHVAPGQTGLSAHIDESARAQRSAQQVG